MSPRLLDALQFALACLFAWLFMLAVAGASIAAQELWAWLRAPARKAGQAGYASSEGLFLVLGLGLLVLVVLVILGKALSAMQLGQVFR